MEYLAHMEEDKQQSLKNHLTGTAQYSKETGESLGIGAITELIALFHDFGKYSDEFQAYLRRGDRNEKGSVDHSSAGAAFLINQYGALKDTNIRLLLDMITYAITAHHGMYDTVDKDGEDKFSGRLKKFSKEELEELYNRWSKELETDEAQLKQKLQGVLNELQVLKPLYELSSTDKELHFYIGCLERLLLSVQIDSDWTNTAAAMGEETEEAWSAEEVYGRGWKHYQQYMKDLNEKAELTSRTKQEKEINFLRGEIQKECLDFTKNCAGIYRLPIPTGGGKTLTSLGYALKMASEYTESEKEISHIFYISPFISITEQNADVIKKAIGEEKWVLEHHSNITQYDERKNQPDTAWKEPVICTTMVQFLNTLFSNQKKSIRRFHQLKKSIIIIDEVQSLPVKTIYTFNLMMNFLSKICGATIILCTATQPALDSESIKKKIEYNAPRDMILGIDDKFRQFDRVVIRNRFREQDEKDSLESLAELIEEDFFHTNSILVILNKKQTVQDLYDVMKENLTDVKIYYLTTNLCPEHRSGRIQEIKEELAKKANRVLIISTNLIEAGVDLSVEKVYRSLAGLDAIAQAAGRCNRNGELEKGYVTVFELEGDEAKQMQELLTAQDKTKEIAYRKSLAEDSESMIYPKWIQQYYEALYEELQNKMNFSLVGELRGETIYNLLSNGFQDSKRCHFLMQAFKTAGEHYKTIEEGITILVPYGEGQNLICQLEQCEDKKERRELLRKVQRYTVSVFPYQEKSLLEKGVICESNIFPGVYIAKEYDEEKGLKDELPFKFF